jgi:hypothetical protein
MLTTKGAGNPRPNFRQEVREVEAHVRSLSSDKDTQVKIISKAQSLTLDNEHNLTVLAIAKKRIINEK